MKLKMLVRSLAFSFLAAGALLAQAAGEDTYPDKPIKIDLNVNITQEVRIKLDREVTDLIANNPDLF